MQLTMGFLNTLIQTVRNDAGICQEAVAAKADIATSTVSRCENGDLEVSARLVKALGELTEDIRLPHYLFPWLFRTMVPTRQPPADVQALITDEIALLEEIPEALRYMVKIVADGRVDATDDGAIAKLLGKHDRVRGLTMKIDNALAALREKAGRRSTA